MLMSDVQYLIVAVCVGISENKMARGYWSLGDTMLVEDTFDILLLWGQAYCYEGGVLIILVPPLFVFSLFVAA